MYETLEALVAAYRSGKLSAPLVLDNDDTFVYADKDGTPFGDDVESVFRMDPYDLMEAALDLLGVPHEHV